MAYEHLKFSRETPLPDCHKKKGFAPNLKPDDPRAFGVSLRQTFEAAKQPAAGELTGYDNRILLKVQLREGASAPDLRLIPGVELVSQENKSVVLAFANQTGLENFESRLSSLARDGQATRAEILYALKSFEHWTADDRKGAALRQHGLPDAEKFVLDVELWPLERTDQRNALFAAFRANLQERNIEALDTLNQPSLVMVRVRCTQGQVESALLNHRDVRMVDLPPNTGVALEVLLTDVNQISVPSSPPEHAPCIAVLDTGLTTGHPLLKGVSRGTQISPVVVIENSPPSSHLRVFVTEEARLEFFFQSV